MSAVRHGSFLFLLAAYLIGFVAADSGDDFSNNLFTDLAPLLALFGERVTMQFMSQSMGWADNVILAMAPLGIITAIISAIRVGGPSWLKALIGRARENLAVAETELMSSTSKEVCELWNGEGVVRCTGSAPIVEFVCLLPVGTETGSERGPDTRRNMSMMYLCDAVRREHLQKIDLDLRDDFRRWRTSLYSRFSAKRDAEQQPANQLPQETIIIQDSLAAAPNISLNSHNQVWRGELRAVAVFGTVLQLGVLVYSGFATYYPTLKFQKDSLSIAGYAFPCVAAGTIVLVTGILLCAHVVESSTTEDRYQASGGYRARLVWLQQSQTVSDQIFSPFAIFSSDDRAIITTSRRAESNEKPAGLVDKSIIAFVSKVTQVYRRFSCNDEPDGHNWQDHVTILAIKTVLGTVVSLCGFIVQFIGLRGMHWSASIAQLGAVLVMTCLRAWVRRGLAMPLRSKPLSPGFELEWFAMTLGDLDTATWLVTSNFEEQDAKSWKMVTGGDPETYEKLEKTREEDHLEQDLSSDSKAQTVMTIRRDLGRLAAWRGPSSAEAMSLANSIEITMNALFGSSSQSTFIWSVQVTCHPSHGQASDQKVKFRLKRETGGWKIDSDDIEAALSLWQYSVNKKCQQQLENKQEQQAAQETQPPKDDTWRRAHGLPAKRNLRLLGPSTVPLRRDLLWWIPRDAARITEVEFVGNGKSEVENHKIVGCGFNAGLASQPCQRTRYKAKALATSTFDAMDIEEANTGHALLATESYDPLKLLYAQDMFSAFMWAAVKTLQDPVAGGADPRPNESNNTDSKNTWKSFTLRNDGLSKMAEDVCSTGLGSLGQIYASIITPLSVQQKLPQADAAIKWMQQHAKPYIQSQDWDAAADIYVWLVRAAKTSGIATKATAALMELLRMVVFAIDSSVGQDNFERKIHFLEYLKLDIEDELANAGQPVLLSSLMRLFKAQGRDWKSDRLRKLVQARDWPQTGEADEVDEMKAFARTLEVPVLGRKEPANCIEKLIPHMASIDARDSLGRTALHYAAAGGRMYKDVMKELLKKEAVINARDLLGRTALHYAVGAGHYAEIDVTEELLYSRASVHAQDLLGWTPLHWAAKTASTSLVQVLLEYKALINAQDLLEWTPLHYAAAAVTEGRQMTTKYLVQEGADIEARGINGQTPLHCAAIMGHEDVVISLVEAGAAINIQDASGSTALLLAAYKGHTKVVDYLWKGANKKLRDHTGKTALHHAAAAGHADVVELLLERGDDKTARDRNGQMPFFLAGINGHARIVKLLVGEDVLGDEGDGDLKKMLHAAAANGHIDVVELLARGTRKDARYKFRQTPLHLASRHGQTHVVELLIGRGVEKNAKDCLGNTPVHLASANAHTSTLKKLVQRDADVKAGNRYGQTPLHLATVHGNTKIVEQLIKHGADINARDKYGRTPIHFSAAFGDAAIVELLINQGADKDAEDNYGRTPLHIAKALLDVNDPDMGVNNSHGGAPAVSAMDDRADQTLGSHASTRTSRHEDVVQPVIENLDDHDMYEIGNIGPLNIDTITGRGIQGKGKIGQLNIDTLTGYGIRGIGEIGQLNIDTLTGYGIRGEGNIGLLNINKLNGQGIFGDGNIGRLNINTLVDDSVLGHANDRQFVFEGSSGYRFARRANIPRLVTRKIRGEVVTGFGNVVQVVVDELDSIKVSSKYNSFQVVTKQMFGDSMGRYQDVVSLLQR